MRSLIEELLALKMSADGSQRIESHIAVHAHNAAIDQAISALKGNTVMGDGLATGNGKLQEDALGNSSPASMPTAASAISAETKQTYGKAFAEMHASLKEPLTAWYKSQGSDDDEAAFMADAHCVEIGREFWHAPQAAIQALLASGEVVVRDKFMGEGSRLRTENSPECLSDTPAKSYALGVEAAKCAISNWVRRQASAEYCLRGSNEACFAFREVHKAIPEIVFPEYEQALTRMTSACGIEQKEGL